MNNLFAGIFQKIKSLSDSTKSFVAGSITVIIVIAIGMASNQVYLIFNKTSPGTSIGQQESSSSVYFESTLSLYDVNYVLVPYLDLPIYPEEWTKKQFSDIELSKPNLSGPEVDADGDGLSNRQEFLFNTNPKKSDTFCSTQPEETNCNKKSDGDRVATGKQPKNNAFLPLNNNFLLEKKYTEDINSLRTVVQYGLNLNVDFPTIYADGLAEKSDGWYAIFENELVVLDQNYKPLIENEYRFFEGRTFQFYVELLQAAEKEKLPDLSVKYGKRLDAVSTTKAGVEHKQLQNINIGIYSTTQNLASKLVELKKQPENKELQINVQMLFRRLVKMNADFLAEYETLKQANLI